MSRRDNSPVDDGGATDGVNSSVRGKISVAKDGAAHGQNPREGIHEFPHIIHICTYGICEDLQSLWAVWAVASHWRFFVVVGESLTSKDK